MSNRNSDSASLASAPPLSPFSSVFSVQSEVTSDNPPDLGDFASVFRALNDLQSQARQPSTRQEAAASEPSHAVSDYDSDAVHSTVWDRDPVRSYLSSDQDDQAGDLQSDEEDNLSEIEGGHVFPVELPTLGALDSALVFLAAEREKLAAQTVSREGQLQSDWQHIVSPRRKRRRKRKHSKSHEGGANTIAPTPDLSYSSTELSSSPEHSHRAPASVPGLLPFKHSLSTPNLLLVSQSPTDQRFNELRSLSIKLAADFPEDAHYLEKVPRLSTQVATGENFIDVRGSLPPNTGLPPVHVFIDHSNIFIGLKEFAKLRLPASNRRRDNVQMCHPALYLILERGRLVARREMAASSPLREPLEMAYLLGYEVSIFARVPREDDDAERTVKTYKNSFSPTDSDSAVQRRNNHSRTPSNPTHGVTSVSSPSGRSKYREQGVDELLQLKMHQAIVEVDRPLPGSTIVLATGDGNAGEFNDEGFLGCVRTALKKGWRVELYTWEDKLSRAYVREFGGRTWKGQFKIIGLEKYGAELLQT